MARNRNYLFVITRNFLYGPKDIKQASKIPLTSETRPAIGGGVTFSVDAKSLSVFLSSWYRTSGY